MTKPAGGKIKFGYQVVFGRFSQEQRLINAKLAEEAEFDALWVGDHFHPWAHEGFSGGFAWTWIAAAAQRIRGIRIGSSVTAPIMRYHPAIVAQAFAALSDLSPGRIFLGVGGGEAMNEKVTGHEWLSPKKRLEMLEEAITLIRSLWTNDFLDFSGSYYRTRSANLYTKPRGELPIVMAAHGEKAASLAGRLADGLVTIPQAGQKHKLILETFLKSAAENGRDASKMDKAIIVYASIDNDFHRALRAAKPMASSMNPAVFAMEVVDPRELERLGVETSDDIVIKGWVVDTGFDRLISVIERHVSEGFDHIVILSLSPDEPGFIQQFSEKVIRRFRA